MSKTRSKTYQLGASHERSAIKAYLKRLRSEPKTLEHERDFLTEIIGWIDARTKRFNARPGGLQGRKRKAAK